MTFIETIISVTFINVKSKNVCVCFLKDRQYNGQNIRDKIQTT